MTRKQQEFYRILINQMMDFNEDFHKEFTIARIEQISDDNLKYLLEDINTDKDNIVKKKGYITYAKFIYYADKMIDKKIELTMKPQTSKVDELYNKRELLLNTIHNQTKSLQERNDLIENLKNKVVMFKKEDGKNILDEIDYFIIEQFGFYNFFDENKNYMIKEEIERYLKSYMTNQMLLKQSDTKKLINN
ncbi:MAG: hypothetical protein K8R39_12455 [Arcobacteraceae bacterium]|nr:hypothetical protein [Arcobacteraceae bacterium]